MYTPKLPERQLTFIDSLKRFSKKPIARDLSNIPGGSMENAMQGLLGNYFLRQMAPKDFNIDLFKHAIEFNPTDKLSLGLSEEGKNKMLNLNWRF
tara:strand:+ start:63 stop:347 length:285 start_codon:yes stop_codon:yes gene_type:complete